MTLVESVAGAARAAVRAARAEYAVLRRHSRTCPNSGCPGELFVVGRENYARVSCDACGYNRPL